MKSCGPYFRLNPWLVTQMRTPFLIGALSAVATMASAAQVYSVNTVGRINLMMVPGFNLVANQLNRTPNNSLRNVIPRAPVESQVLKFVNNNYQMELFDGTAWIKADGSPGTLSTSPGEGFFFFNPDPTNVTVTLEGDVPRGDPRLCMPPGFSLVSSILPQAVSLSPGDLLPTVIELQFLSWDPATQTYKPPIFYDGSGWIHPDGTPVPPPAAPLGTGFFIFNPGPVPICWTRIFTVN